MANKKYKIGKEYSKRELMELAVQLMYNSIPEHTDRADPKVGAVLATENGTLVNTAYRGELRQGDHAEFTVLERKHRTDKLDGFVIYATLEPCAPGARSITKLGCAERIVNARIKKAYVGIEDPDPKVKGNGIAYLAENKIEIDFFDKDLQEKILVANTRFLAEATERAKLAEQEEIEPAFTELDRLLDNFNLNDFSSDALEKFKEKPLVALEKLQDFSAPTFSVNPKIANVFYQMKFIEKRNIGMEELHKYSKLMGVNKPTIKYNEPYLQVKLWKKPETKLEPIKDDIIEFVSSMDKISSGDYANKYGGSTKTASRRLNELVDEGILEREGEKRGTRYFLRN